VTATADPPVTLPVLRSELLASVPAVVHGITRRVPGLGQAEGNTGYASPRDAEDAWRSRARWCRAIGVEPERLVLASQVHGTAVRRVSSADAGRGARPGSATVGVADVLMTDEPDLPLMMLFADCVPLLLVDPRRPAVAVVHAGWRGTVAGVARAAVEAMAGAFDSRAGDLLAYLGPAIGPCCYEVGLEVVAAWRRYAGPDAGPGLGASGRTLDLAGANETVLLSAGLDPSRVERSGLCTRCHAAEWFSHRAQGAGTGRHAAVIALSRPPAGGDERP
jgi:polyphenol oxidase